MSKYITAMKAYGGADSDESDTEVAEVDVDKLPPLDISPDEHKLQYTYCLWYHRGSYKIKNPSDYSKSLHLIGRCASVEQWWGLYCRLIRPSTLKPYRELHLFKSGIKAMWEDPQNAKGGKWVIRLRKNKIDRAWENVCMAMLGEQFLVGSEICGVVLSTRFPEDLLSVWNRSAADQNCTNRIRDTLRRILNLSPNTPMEYKSHCDSLKYLKSVSSSSPSASTTVSTTNSSPAGNATTSTSNSNAYNPPITRNNGAGNGVIGAPTSRFFSRPFTTTSHS
ncbi:eukaryotic translation initiation factor 4E type 2 isoform X2 [Sitodiplosis mosellana]|uniref:eukaryotic translation initiation factor 4E type 2 isoform X2 n=1 Tax=Sitodiplosis mosellana TaxID=263140 RepID=UPI002444EC46|nr:eukaryotic translation initiation factor 4E type 2 isoform X2 [Sitodiplosis mosellana]